MRNTLLGNQDTHELLRSALANREDDTPVGLLGDHLTNDFGDPAYHKIGSQLLRWFHGERMPHKETTPLVIHPDQTTIKAPGGTTLVYRTAENRGGQKMHHIVLVNPWQGERETRYPTARTITVPEEKVQKNARPGAKSTQEQWYPGWVKPLDEARKGTSAKQYHTNPIHNLFADWLEEHYGGEDHRSLFTNMVRERMKPREASKAAETISRTGNGVNGVLPSRPVLHKLPDGTTISVVAHQPMSPEYYSGARTIRGTNWLDLRTNGEPDAMPHIPVGLHVAWDGPAKRWYNTAMTRKGFSQWVDQFPEHIANGLRTTYGNQPNMYMYDHEDEPETPKQKNAAFRQNSPGQANREAVSNNHQKHREIALQILKEAGLSPATVRNVLAHEQGKGSRSTVLQIIDKQISPELAQYVGSWWGLLSRERAVTTFHPGEGGDSLHILTSPMPADQMSELLERSRVPSFSIESHPQGSRAYVFNPGNTLTNNINQAAGAINASHTALPGTGFRIGASSGSAADSRTAYRQTITSFERGATPGTEAN